MKERVRSTTWSLNTVMDERCWALEPVAGWSFDSGVGASLSPPAPYSPTARTASSTH